MKSYLFDMGDSNKGPIGFCARVTADSPEEAAEKLNAALPECVEVRDDDDDDIEYISVYFGMSAITAKDAQEEDDEG